MASQNKNGFSSLSVYRVEDEEIRKLKNNRIHFTYPDNNKNKQNLHQSEQIIIKVPLYGNKNIGKNPKTKSAIKMNNPSIKSGEENELRSKSRNNYQRASNSSKEKDQVSGNKKSVNTFAYKLKPGKKRNQNHIDKIIIDIVNNNDDDNATIKTDSNYYENEKLYKTFIDNNRNNKDNNSEINNNDALDKNKLKNSNNSLQKALNIVQNRWFDNFNEVQELNMTILCDEITKKKREIELIIDRWNNKKNIVKGESLSLIKRNKNPQNIEINKNNNDINRWKNNIRKQNDKFFSIIKKVDKNKFLYSEKNYINDLSKNIYIPKDNINYFCALNNDNFIDNYNKIDYKILKPKNKNQLEVDLFNFYQEKKMNYLKNKDNNDDLKINPIYVLNDKQIKQLYEDLNKAKDKQDNINSKNEFKQSQLSVAKQTAIDYEIIEIFTPKNNNIDNNSNYNTKRSNFNNELKNDKASEINIGPEKKPSGEFGQYTPISMLNEKFGIYAVSRNIKYCIPERQGGLNFHNSNKNKIINYNPDSLKRNKFSLKIERCQNYESYKSSKNTTKRNDKSLDKKNIIDYSKYSIHSMESSDKEQKK